LISADWYDIQIAQYVRKLRSTNDSGQMSGTTRGGILQDHRCQI
jgi:hypothetical protein